jgi:hypothetical protein
MGYDHKPEAPAKGMLSLRWRFRLSEKRSKRRGRETSLKRQ